ncbi:hypothetical protein T484DRAFT_1880818, partial [Baffinella frigidus]
VLEQVLQRLAPQDAPSEDGAGGEKSSKSVRVFFVGEGEELHPSDEAHSVVYVALNRKGFFYVGETDDFRGRVEQHRSSPRLENAVFAYAKNAAAFVSTFA